MKNAYGLMLSVVVLVGVSISSVALASDGSEEVASSAMPLTGGTLLLSVLAFMLPMIVMLARARSPRASRSSWQQR